MPYKILFRPLGNHENIPRVILIVRLVDALTYLNYAFVYINPSIFQIIPIDIATPISLFDDLAALKLTKADLKIFVSIGG
jgi:hypothetical protein